MRPFHSVFMVTLLSVLLSTAVFSQDRPYFRMGVDFATAGVAAPVDTDSDGVPDDVDEDDDNDTIPDTIDEDDNGNGIPDIDENHAGAVTSSLGTSFPAWAETGTSFSSVLSSVGGTPAYNYLFTGAHPTGLSISGSDIQGTFQSQGLFNFSITVSDADGSGVDGALGPYSLEVWDPISVSGYPGASISGTVGEPLIIPAPVFSGAKPGIGYALQGGNGNAAINPATGAITINSSVEGSVGPLTVTLTDALNRSWVSAPFTAGFYDAVSMSYGGAGYIYRQGIAAATPLPQVSGGRGVKTFSVIGGTEPAGMPLTYDGAFFGTPTGACDDCSVTVYGQDADGRGDSATFVYTILPPLAVDTGIAAPLSWRVGTPITPIEVTSNGYAGASYAVIGLPNTANVLPAGVTIDPATGVISGTPTAAANGSNLVVRVTDVVSSADSAPFSYTVVQAAVAIPSSDTATSGTSKTISPTYSNLAPSGSTTRLYSLVNAPAGMQISQSTGVITWASPTIGTYNSIRVSVLDRDGATILSNPLSLVVTAVSAGDLVLYGGASEWYGPYPYTSNSFIGSFTQPALVTRGTTHITLTNSSGSCTLNYGLYSGPSATGPWSLVTNGSHNQTCATSGSGTSVRAKFNVPSYTGQHFRMTMSWPGSVNALGSTGMNLGSIQNIP